MDDLDDEFERAMASLKAAGDLPECAYPPVRRDLAPGIAERAGIGKEPPPLPLGELVAKPEPGVHSVVDAERLGAVAVEVVRKAVDVDAELAGLSGTARGCGEHREGEPCKTERLARAGRRVGCVHVVVRGSDRWARAERPHCATGIAAWQRDARCAVCRCDTHHAAARMATGAASSRGAAARATRAVRAPIQPHASAAAYGKAWAPSTPAHSIAST